MRGMLTSEKTLLFAEVCLRVREIRIVEFPHPRPPPLSIFHMRRWSMRRGVCADWRDEDLTRACALAAQGRGGFRGLRPFRRGRARERT